MRRQGAFASPHSAQSSPAPRAEFSPQPPALLLDLLEEKGARWPRGRRRHGRAATAWVADPLQHSSRPRAQPTMPRAFIADDGPPRPLGRLQQPACGAAGSSSGPSMCPPGRDQQGCVVVGPKAPQSAVRVSYPNGCCSAPWVVWCRAALESALPSPRGEGRGVEVRTPPEVLGSTVPSGVTQAPLQPQRYHQALARRAARRAVFIDRDRLGFGEQVLQAEAGRGDPRPHEGAGRQSPARPQTGPWPAFAAS